MQAFVERYRKTHDGHTPSMEMPFDYTAVWATAAAVKLAGTTTDASAVRAAFDRAVKSLPPNENPHGRLVSMHAAACNSGTSRSQS